MSKNCTESSIFAAIMISKKCKYAIKALIHIAGNAGNGRPVDSSEIAAKQNIPKKFLEIILRDLKNHRYLTSRRGKSGGYNLLKKPEDIYLTEIMRIMDGPIAMLPCASLNYYESCQDCDEETCTLRPVFEKIRDLTLNVLDENSIKKLA